VVEVFDVERPVALEENSTTFGIRCAHAQ